jgi:pimeloyl-ACP methyl ester carboxylesterase
LTAYFISGLAADRRAFARLKLPAYITIKHVEWIEPLEKESLQDYCKRLSSQINTDDEFILIGLSFGGMVAIELNRFLHPKDIILISSIATKNELPLRFKVIYFLKLHRILPANMIKLPVRLIYWFFNARTKKEKSLLLEYIQNVSNNYLKWSINAVLSWKNSERPQNLFHIHGTADRIFPFDTTHADVKVKDGGHLMVYDKADEINRILNERLQKFS